MEYKGVDLSGCARLGGLTAEEAAVPVLAGPLVMVEGAFTACEVEAGCAN